MPAESATPKAVLTKGSWLRAPRLDQVDSFWRERPLQPWWSWWHLPELAAVFTIGVCVMNFLYLEATNAGGVPGHDSWYHVKMAELLPQIGATSEFPWLQRVYFNQLNREFVSHHFGFHASLVPFIHAAKWMGYDALTGARWAMAAFFGASLTLFQLILMTQRVRCRWLWLALYLLMPSQFFSRHAFVRAISPALACMFAIIVLMFRAHYIWAGIAVAAFTNLYLGGTVYAPVIVICYALAGIIGPRGDCVSWRLCAWALLGWLMGVMAYPYFDGMFEFLHLQIFGSGLSPDISVGREWKPYEKVWLLTQRSAWTLVPFVLAAVLRMRLGSRINAKELSVVLVSIVFGGLMLKSRRFVEYWPPFAVLATALLAGPVLNRWAQTTKSWMSRLGGSRPFVVVAAGLLPVCLSVAAASAAVIWVALPKLAGLQKTLRPKYDLQELNSAMAVLKTQSQPGAVVFTEDWDNFPVYFYANDHNYYCVGLDPKFTQAKEPILWERYKAITRGKTPTWYTVPQEQRRFVGGRDRVRIRIEDIRDYFAAQYVLVDQDHKAFRKKLDQAGSFCRRIYPPAEESDQTGSSSGGRRYAKSTPYAVYRVYSHAEQAAAERAAKASGSSEPDQTSASGAAGLPSLKQEAP